LKRKKNVKETYTEVFKIPQIPKIEGIRKQQKYVKERFVSSLFGYDVKDEIVVPFVVRVIGDKVKKYDTFRIKPKMDEAPKTNGKSNKYYEFKDGVISKETRKEIFGIDSYNNKNNDINVRHDEPARAAIQNEESSQPIRLNDFTEPINNLPPWMRGKTSETVIEDDSLEADTFKRPSKGISIKANFDEEVSDDLPVQNTPKYVEKPKYEKPKYQTDNGYQLPPLTLLKKVERNRDEKPQWLIDQVDRINKTLSDHVVEGVVANSKKGPTVTRHEISLEPGVPVKLVTRLQDNLMMSLSAKSLRIEAPIPGKPFVGIEVPNKIADIVSFGNVVDTDEFLEDHKHPLKVALGEDIDGTNIYVDIAKMPHGLIAGGTGSGKSVCVNSILISLLLKNRPEDLKLILIDPKMVELTPYNDLPHLITPVITDPKMAATALNWVVDEMEERYKKFAGTRSRDINSFNENVKKGFIEEEKMPLIVIVIDELADLMMAAAHDVENAIQRITQKARAAGIHLLVATQRPTVDVIRGTIKSNIPTRIAFRVASFTDSTTILDGAGAEQLLGRGDMLLKETDRPIRLQGAYISENEIDGVIDFIRQQSTPNYILKHEDLRNIIQTKDTIDDELFPTVARFVVQERICSINAIGKEFNVGFNRAQKLATFLEQYNIVSTTSSTKAREVLVDMNELEDILEKLGLS
jgi:S-DNA-T family DNA segregation ATPase FtsK/SpoIIIE